MRRVAKSIADTSFYAAALEGLELQKKRIEGQIAQVRALLGKKKSASLPVAGLEEKPVKKRRLSAAARKRIALAQKRRWAEYRKKA